MRRSTEKHDDFYFVKGINNANRQVFTDLFDTYYVDLVMFCGTYIHDLEQCRDIVSGVFMDLWVRGNDLAIDKSLKSYLLGMVKNRALNVIRHKKVEDSYAQDVLNDGILASHDVDSYILFTEMKVKINKALERMPEKVRQAYTCYIEEGMKTKEIAMVQKVTQRTVELRIKKALGILKSALLILIIAVII